VGEGKRAIDRVPWDRYRGGFRKVATGDPPMPDDVRKPAIDKSRMPSRHVTIGPCVSEAIGLALPGSAGAPAPCDSRDAFGDRAD
jgi:hypothetical protein